MSNRTIVGPLFTHAGFQSWFLVCMQQSIVAVPMGFWFALTGNKAATIFVGGVAGAILGLSGNSTHSKTVARLAHGPEFDLTNGKGHVTYQLADLTSIAYKRKALSSSEIILANRSGKKKVFGIMNAGDQPAIVKALGELYGTRFKMQ